MAKTRQFEKRAVTGRRSPARNKRLPSASRRPARKARRSQERELPSKSVARCRIRPIAATRACHSGRVTLCFASASISKNRKRELRRSWGEPSRPTISRLSDGHRCYRTKHREHPDRFRCRQESEAVQLSQSEWNLADSLAFSRLVPCRGALLSNRPCSARSRLSWSPNAEGMIHARCHIVAARSPNLDYHSPLPLQRPLTGVVRP